MPEMLSGVIMCQNVGHVTCWDNHGPPNGARSYVSSDKPRLVKQVVELATEYGG